MPSQAQAPVCENFLSLATNWSTRTYNIYIYFFLKGGDDIDYNMFSSSGQVQLRWYWGNPVRTTQPNTLLPPLCTPRSRLPHLPHRLTKLKTAVFIIWCQKSRLEVCLHKDIWYTSPPPPPSPTWLLCPANACLVYTQFVGHYFLLPSNQINLCCS